MPLASLLVQKRAGGFGAMAGRLGTRRKFLIVSLGEVDRSSPKHDGRSRREKFFRVAMMLRELFYRGRTNRELSVVPICSHKVRA